MRKTMLLAGCLLVLTAALPAQEKKEPEIITRLKKAKIDGPFTLIVHLKLKSDADHKKILQTAKECVTMTRKEKGCIAYDLHQDLEDPTKFVFFEKWKSPKDLEAHFEAAHTKMLLGALSGAVDGTPTFSIYKLAE
jgi:quinol monooxygenase YgiN